MGQHTMWHLSEDHQCGIYWPPGIDPNKPTVAFDLDHTIIRPKGGRLRPKTAADWEWNWDSIAGAERLCQVAETHNVVLLSNQSGLTSAHDIGAFCANKIAPVVAGLKSFGVSPAFLVASGYTKYRKPKTAMWDLYCRLLGRGSLPAFYVGDAAGRLAPKDHSDCDLKFALNLGVPFLTPQTFFGITPTSFAKNVLGGGVSYLPCDYPPPRNPTREQIDFWITNPTTSPSTVILEGARPAGPELLITVGCPGSGKTAMARALCDLSHQFGRADAVRISQDDTQSAAKCQKLANSALARGQRVIVDNTNRDVKTRRIYLDMARKHGAPVTCIHLESTKELSCHLDALRVDHPDPHQRKNKRLPAVAIHSYFTHFEQPRLEEGFHRIVSVPFEFDPRATPVEHFHRWHY